MYKGNLGRNEENNLHKELFVEAFIEHLIVQ